MKEPANQKGEERPDRGTRPGTDPAADFAEDGVDLTLIRWFLGLSPYERLQAAQDMIDTVWKLREAE